MYFVYSCKQKERREEGTLDLYKAIHRSVISPHVPAVFVQLFHKYSAEQTHRHIIHTQLRILNTHYCKMMLFDQFRNPRFSSVDGSSVEGR